MLFLFNLSFSYSTQPTLCTDDDHSFESYDSDNGDDSVDSDNDSDNGDDDLVGDEPLGGWNGCGTTKVKLFAQSIKEIDSVIDVDDTSPSATKRLGDIVQSQYAKVEEGMKKYNAMKRDSDNSPEFINAPEFKSICDETARLIKQEFPGYNGDLCDFVELFLLGRVSKGTEHRNTGKTQGARMLVDAKLREEKDHFNHQVLLHPKFFLERAHDRRLIEECPSLHEAIKAILYSSSKENHLFVNDSLRAFYEPIQHRFLLEVLKALNPNKVIVIRLCQNGLMSPDGNEEVIQLVNERELGLKANRMEISHISPSNDVPVNPKSKDPKQSDIIKLAKKFESKWEADGKYPDEVKDAFIRGQNYILSEERATKFRETVRNTKTKLREVNPNDLLHDISTTEKGSSIVNNGRLEYFGHRSEEHQVSDDAAFLFRTSHNSTTTVKDMNGIRLPIENVASAFACFELRKKLGLIPKNAKLMYIFFGKGKSRSTICSVHEEKLLDAILTNKIGHVVTTRPNRINEDSIVVQTYLEPNVGFHFSKDSGKKLMPILRNEAMRKGKHQTLINTCNKDVALVEQSHLEVTTSDLILHNLLKKVNKSRMPKGFIVQVEDYNSITSYVAPLFPLSSLVLKHQNQLEECNDKAKTYLEQHPKPSKKKRNHQQEADRLYSGINVSNADEVFDSINQVLSTKNGSKAEQPTIDARWKVFINRHENDTCYHLIDSAMKKRKRQEKDEKFFSTLEATSLHPNDILPLNLPALPVTFQQVIENLKTRYQSEPYQVQQQIAGMVVTHWKQTQRGRFVKQVFDSNGQPQWKVLDDDAARERCTLAFKAAIGIEQNIIIRSGVVEQKLK